MTSLGRRLYADALDVANDHACQSCEDFGWVVGNSEVTLGQFLAESWIGVEKSASHHLSQTEIADDTDDGHPIL
jgi:hypothetical protein